MDSIEDLIKGKAEQIDVDGHRQEIALAQEELDRYVDAQSVARVTAVEGSAMTVQVKSSSQASNLRIQRIPLLQAVSKSIDRTVDRLQIRIGSR